MVKNKNKKDITATAVVLSSLEQQAAPLLRKVQTIEQIKSQADFKLAGMLVHNLKEIGKIAEQEKRRMLDPVKLTEERIREHFKPFEQKIKEIDTSIKLRMSIYLETNNKKLAKIDQDFEEGKIKTVSTYAAKVTDLQISSTNVSVRKVKKLKITDANLIPRGYLVPDESKILEALKQGKTVPGCTIEIVDSIAI